MVRDALMLSMNDNSTPRAASAPTGEVPRIRTKFLDFRISILEFDSFSKRFKVLPPVFTGGVGTVHRDVGCVRG